LPWEIGRLTPGELLSVVQARLEQGARARIELAWAIAMFSRQKRLPPLERILKPAQRERVMKTPGQARAEFEELRERLGK